jgi:hypothetical protein
MRNSNWYLGVMEIDELAPEAKQQQVNVSSLYQAFLISAGASAVATSLIRLLAVWLVSDITTEIDIFQWRQPIAASVIVAAMAALYLFALGKIVPKPFTAFKITSAIVLVASLIPAWTQLPNISASLAATLMHITAGSIIWQVMDR